MKTASSDRMSTTTAQPVRLLLVDDDAPLRQTLARRLQPQGMGVTEASTVEEGLELADSNRYDLVVLDPDLPGANGVELLQQLKEKQPELEAIVLTAHGSLGMAILAMKRGAYAYLAKPFNQAELEIHLWKAYEKVQLARRERQWLDQVACESSRYRLVGSSPAIRRVVQTIEKVAPTDATVLVRGDSGTGKELVARAIHFNSRRRDRPLVAINCAAMQETLLESELFGHERGGSFKGASQARPGLVEIAEGGTLFIDEVAEMAPRLQAKLLRVLDNGHFRRVGATQELQVDVRVVAATNKLLEDEIKANRFREELYYRLSVVTIVLPTLRDRPGDIPALVEHFLTTRQLGPTRHRIEPEALDALEHHDWPGNVRELANVLERAQLLAGEHLIALDDLPGSLAHMRPAPALASHGIDTKLLREIERRHVLDVLRQEKGNKVHAAKVLGISRRALYRLLEKYESKVAVPDGRRR